METSVYLNSCYSCFSAEYYYIFTWDNSHAESTRFEQKKAPEGLDEDLCYDLMRSHRLENVRVK